MMIPGFNLPEDLSPDEQIQRAERLVALSKNPDLVYLLTEASKTTVEQWADGKTWQEREGAWQRLQGIRALDTEIQKVVDMADRAVMQREAQ